MLGRHLIKSWSVTEGLVSLFVTEAENYRVAKAVGMGLGYQALLQDIGIVWTATMGICGFGHIDTQSLWIHHRARGRSIELCKVPGTDNPADLFINSSFQR